MKKIITLLFSALTSFGIAQTILITPTASGLEPFNFGDVVVGTTVDQNFTVTTTSLTPINLTYVWGNAGYSGSTSCNYVSRFSVESFPTQIDAANPGTITLRFYPQTFNTYSKVQGNCIKTGTSNGVGDVVGDLQISENDVYAATMDLRGTGALTTAINEVRNANASFVYPNPTNNVLNIVNSNAIHYEIVDTKGLQVAQGKLIGQNIDVSSLASGMYILKLMTIEGEVDAKRVIKL